MRRHDVWALAFVAVLAVCGVAVADASAATFRSSGTGLLNGKQTTSHIFDTGSGKFACAQAASSGTVTEAETEVQEIGVKYSGCSFFGFPIEASEAQYLVSANGSVTIGNTLTMKMPSAGCSIAIGPQVPLGSVSFVNSSGKVEVAFNLAGIKWKGSGGLCGGEGTGGTYTGKSVIELVGGTFEWVK